MARPKKDLNEKRLSGKVGFKPTPTERKFLEEECKATGYTIAEYIREKVLNDRMTVYLSSEIDKETYKNIVRLGGNLNQLLVVMNTKIKAGESDLFLFTDLLIEVKSTLGEIRKLREFIK